MDKEIDFLKQKVRSEEWNACKNAVLRLAEINSDESTAILLDMLQSDDSHIRDLAAVGIKTARNQKYFLPLMKRINQLGFKAKIEPLVSALRNFDCSRNLYDIANLNLNAGKNTEIKQSTTLILNEQSFP